MKRIWLLLIMFFIFAPFFCALADDNMVDIHGFVAQGYLKSDHNNFLADTEDGSFQFNEMGINFSTSMGENLRLGMQLFSRDQELKTTL